MKKEKKKKGYSCFYWPSLSSGPFKRFKLLIRNIQFAYQRIRYGFCESDVWDIDRWFLKVVPAMLYDLRENALDVPECLLSNGKRINGQILIPDENEIPSAVEKWKAILKQMAFYIREADEDNCSRKNPYENQYRMTVEEFIEKYGESGEKIKTSEEIEKEKQTGEIHKHMSSEILEYQEMRENYLREDNKIWLYRDECKNKGIQMFQEWFWDLWG